MIEKIKKLISQGQQKAFIIEDEKRKIESDKAQRLQDSEAARAFAEQEKVRKEAERILDCAKGLRQDVDMRSKSLLRKLDIDFSILDDFEILELKKQEESLHAELRELIDKASEFKKFVLPCGDTASPLCKEVTDVSNKCSTDLDVYVSKLIKIVSDRDISEKKLTNSAGLKRNFKKFSGYDFPVGLYIHVEISKIGPTLCPKASLGRVFEG